MAYVSSDPHLAADDLPIIHPDLRVMWRWGRERSLRHRILLNFLAFLISLVTVLLTSGQTIWFGILNFMGCAVLLPWSFLYICGFRFPRIFLRHEAWKQAARCKISGLSAIGSRALWICLIHQSLSMRVCVPIFRE